MGSLRILVVDDHEAVRRGLRSLLSARSDWTVCGEAKDGVEAVEKTKSLQPDLVLMDVGMPRMDGAEAARIIRREIPDTAVIVISQNDPKIVAGQARAAGAGAFVAKSNIARDLLPAIEKVIGENGHSVKRASAKKQTSSAQRSPATPNSTLASSPWVAGGGEMAERIRSLDWSRTPLGPLEQWPQSLRTSVSICLASRFPIVMYWGPEYVVLYNDAYAAILGSKHPWALGQTCCNCWAEIWDTIGPMLDGVVHSGQATWSDDLLLLLERHGYPEECYFSFSFSPIQVETGAVGGVFTAVMETTEKVIGERRLRTLRDLAAKTVDAHSEADAWGIAAQTLAENLQSIPFSVLCQVRGSDNGISILSTAGIDPDHSLCAALRTPGSALSAHVQTVAQSRQIFELKDLAGFAGDPPRGQWQVPPRSAILLPIADRGQGRSSNVLLAAVNPHKTLDDSYRTFFKLVAHQIGTSVSDARAHDEERKRAEALAELDRAKTIFFSNVSHEFRTPLTLMLGPLEDMLSAGNQLPPEQRERLEVAHHNSLRLLKLVNTLLDFSRLEAGRIEASYESTDLARLTSDLASIFRSAIERAGLRLTINCPSLDEPVYVDREMWEKIVFNLLSNAFKFTFEGEIEVSLRKVDNRVELAVRDTGTGIPQPELPHLFERFYRVKGASGRTFEGTGIGLSLVQELSKLHGGTVGVQSQLNQGSTFTVSLPLGRDHLPADRIGAPRTVESSIEPSGEAYVQEALRWLPGGESRPTEAQAAALLSPATPLQPKRGSEKSSRILLADDNADMRSYMQRLLGEEYEVEAVADGESALQTARERRPDLIVSDIMMPRLDGFGLLRALRSDEALKSIPVILLSARAGEESRIEGLKTGADDYLVKPFSSRELLARVQSHLTMARIRQEHGEHERKLRINSELLAAIVASSDDVIVSKSLDGIITSWNHSAERIFGYTAKEAVGQSIMLIIPHDRRDEETEILARLRRGQRVEHFETVRVRKDGSPVNVSLTISPIKDSTGRVVGASKVARDITEQKQAQERERQISAAVLAATAKFRAVFEQTTQFAGIMSNDGILIEANRLCLDACGYRAEEVLGHPFWETGWWRNFPESRDKIRAATPLAAKGIPYREILHYSWADGTERLLDFALYPILDDRAQVLCLHPTGVDITEIKRVEENYRKLTGTLEAEVHARTLELENRNLDVLRQSDLLRIFSQRLLQAQDEERRHIARDLHDSAGQTLTVLGMNLAQLIQKAGRKSPELAVEAEKIHEIVQQLHREIRTTSYLLHPPLLDEIGLSSALNWYVQGLVERSTLQIALDIPEDFGRLPHAMELAIFRLVQECLTNIHRHSGSSTASIRIARHTDGITVDVQDQGKGIAPEKLAELQSGGSGVGIRGMRERLSPFGGKLTIHSDSSGTQISVTIPIPETAEDQGGAEPAHAAA
jgi:PAS domain S-box-containing protein